MDELKPLNEMTDEELGDELEGYLKESFAKHVYLSTPVEQVAYGEPFVFTFVNLPTHMGRFTSEKRLNDVFLCGEEHELYRLSINEAKAAEAMAATVEYRRTVREQAGDAPPLDASDYIEIEPAAIHLEPADFPVFVTEDGKPITGATWPEVNNTPLELVLAWLAGYDALGDGEPDDETLREAARIFTLTFNVFFDVQTVEDNRGDEGKGAARPYVYDKNVMIATDQITGALFDRGREGYIEPAQYWSDEPKEIKSSKNGFVYLQLRLPTTTEITDDISTYELAARHDYWLGAAHKLVREGHTLITGEMILKKNGYDNPYSESMANTMRAAAEAMYQLTHMEIAVDTTNQYGKRKSGGMELNKRTTMRRIFGYEFSFTEWKRKDGTVVPSFELEYKGKGDPVSSCPLLEYQLEHKMFSDVPADDDCLAGLKLSLDHRIMWRYVRRRVLEERTTDRIRFDSMFTTLGMDGDSAAAKRKRRKMIDQLEKMLRRACRDDHDDPRRKRKVKHTRLFKSWRYLEDATGRYGVEIVPL